MFNLKGRSPRHTTLSHTLLAPLTASIFLLRRTSSSLIVTSRDLGFSPSSHSSVCTHSITYLNYLIEFLHAYSCHWNTFVYSNYELNIYVAKIETLDAIWEKEIVMECWKHSLLLITGVFYVTALIVFYTFLWLNYSVWTILNLFSPFLTSSLIFYNSHVNCFYKKWSRFHKFLHQLFIYS